MPRWVAIIFWIWLFVSLAILIMRRVDKRGASAATGETEAIQASTGGAIAASVPASPVEKVWPAPPPPDPDDDTYRMDPAELSDASTSEPASVPGSAPAPDLPTDPAATSAPRATLPELLAGITLPYELVPLTQSDLSVDLANHIVVHTDAASAESVTSAMCDELEKLGYDIERESMLKVRATGERGAVLVEVHPDGASVLDGTARRFPTATEGSVVVEIWAV